MSKTELLPGFEGPFKLSSTNTLVLDAEGTVVFCDTQKACEALVRVLNSHAEVVEACRAALKRGTFSFDAREDVGRVEYQLAEALRKAEVGP